jgi:hypothetical protein
MADQQQLDHPGAWPCRTAAEALDVRAALTEDEDGEQR